jgi:hypothetical protein
MSTPTGVPTVSFQSPVKRAYLTHQNPPLPQQLTNLVSGALNASGITRPGGHDNGNRIRKDTM